MSLTATQESNAPRALCPEDTHPARCIQVVDLGTHHNEKYDKKEHRLRVVWEFPTELHTFNEDKGPEPFVLGRNYTLSLHEDSNLYQMLVAWRGRKFTDDELKGFNVGKLVGAPCMITVVHEEYNGKTRAQINAVTKLPKGLKCPDLISPSFVYEVEQGADDVFEGLPDWLKETIRECEEWKQPDQPTPEETAAAVSGGRKVETNDDDDDDIPF